MKSWKKPTNELIDRALGSFKKYHYRKHFFPRLKNPLWLQPLAERGCFQSPPRIRRFNGYIQFRSWSELQYLKNVARYVPNEVINLVLGLPEVDNPRVYDGILDIALALPGEQSAKLKPKMLEYAGLEHQFLAHRFADLLAHWTAKNQTSAALELSKVLVAFAPDPRFKDKQKRQRENSTDWGALAGPSLHPVPKIGHEAYAWIMAEGVRPLAESEPYKVACLLIDATANMIRLRTHQEELDKEADLSNIWYTRLDESDSHHGRPDKTLVHTLTFACEKVFEKSPDAVADLDKVLRKQRWKIFKRLRHHLYAQNPNKETKPWMRELILEHQGYGLWEHPYEFQQMIRHACEHFGETLLTKTERTDIFDAILAGPSKEIHRHWIVGWLGEEFTEERFQERQARFHRMQFAPFESVLFGEYKTDFEKLKTETNEPISDDYPPFKARSGSVSKRSPRSPEELANLTDETLLTYINEWEEEDEFYGEGEFVEINIEGLSKAFQTVFKESIIPDANRIRFWMENRKRIERPIYVRAMIDVMQAEVKAKNFNKLNEWLTFSEWVLTHPDREPECDYSGGDKSRENPHWSWARRAVADLIRTCLEKDVDVPVTARRQLANLLEILCTQFDWHLDGDEPVIVNYSDSLTGAVNTTRGIALENLINFGFWLQRHDATSGLSEVTTLLERRFNPETEHPLTLPEYAVLGRNYPWIVNLNETWARKHKSDFFPQGTLPAWLAAFGSLVDYSRPFELTFKILRDDFDFALRHLADFKKHDGSEKELIDTLGEHLFTYYLSDMYPLKGDESLLERYYQQTNNDREHWANLFNNVGHHLWSRGKSLEQNRIDKFIAFFEWRLEVKEPTEFRQFTLWLEAECLAAEWRLDAYSKVLDVCRVEDRVIRLRALCDMLPEHTAEVVECFAKLTDGIKDDNLYILTEEAKSILKAGLKSRDKDVRQKAEQAQENLLREGRLDLLHLGQVPPTEVGGLLED